jgi:flagella basal body P-ring formation protein FlgA
MRWLIALVVTAGTAAADTLVAARMIRPQTVLTEADVALRPGPETLELTLEAVLGLESRALIYPGRPIRPSDVGPPALVERNQIVALRYAVGQVTILAEGRSMGRGGAGETLRVTNTASRVTLTGTVQPDGSILVQR